MNTQLALAVEPNTPGYYSIWTETRNRCAGSGGVTWHPSAEAAREFGIASFNRGYRSWRDELRPVPERVCVELLVAGVDRGAWGDLTQAERVVFARDYPWFTNRKNTP